MLVPSLNVAVTGYLQSSVVDEDSKNVANKTNITVCLCFVSNVEYFVTEVIRAHSTSLPLSNSKFCIKEQYDCSPGGTTNCVGAAAT